MKPLASFQEMDTLGEALVRDYFRKTRRKDPSSVDIEGFIRDYLGLRLVYDSFAEEDGNRIGFRADGKAPLLVFRDGKRVPVVYPEGTLVVDRFLERNGESGRRRFTMAHEAAHSILARHVPLQAACFRTDYDGEALYGGDDLKRIFSLNEAFANRLGAAILMPPFLVEKARKRYHGEGRFVSYEGLVPQGEKLAVRKTADALGVSYSAMVNRLRELDLWEIRPAEEYLAEGLGVGGGL